MVVYIDHWLRKHVELVVIAEVSTPTMKDCIELKTNEYVGGKRRGCFVRALIYEVELKGYRYMLQICKYETSACCTGELHQFKDDLIRLKSVDAFIVFRASGNRETAAPTTEDDWSLDEREREELYCCSFKQ